MNKTIFIGGLCIEFGWYSGEVFSLRLEVGWPYIFSVQVARLIFSVWVEH